MKVILQTNVGTLGIVGDVVNVKPGYARNFLIPRGLALPASSRNVKALAHQQRLAEKKRTQVLADAASFASTLEGTQLKFERQAGGEGKLFGSVTAKDIEAALLTKGFTLSRRQIALKDPIKRTGEHDVTIRVHSELKVSIKVSVIAVGGAPPQAAEPEPAPEPEAEPETENAETEDVAKDAPEPPAE